MMLPRPVLPLLFVCFCSFSFAQTSKSTQQGGEGKAAKTHQAGKPTKAGAQPTPAPSPAAAQVDEKLFGAMRWRQVGPFRGGRVLAVTGVPGEPTVFYFGGASGGVWKSTDTGVNWQPIFDKQPDRKSVV